MAYRLRLRKGSKTAVHDYPKKPRKATVAIIKARSGATGTSLRKVKAPKFTGKWRGFR